MKRPTTLLKRGTPIVTHATLGETEGMIAGPANVAQRRANARGRITGIVAGHGGECYWVDHKALPSLHVPFAPYWFEERCIATVAALRARGLRIGSTSGFTRAMMDVLAPEAALRGFAPDVIVTADEVPRARPWPDMCLRNVMELGVSSTAACVKVDDTVAGIEEGLRAGMWMVGVVMTGNELGCTEADLAALRPEEGERLRAEGYARLRAAGAQLVLDGIAELPGAIEALTLGDAL